MRLASYYSGSSRKRFTVSPRAQDKSGIFPNISLPIIRKDLGQNCQEHSFFTKNIAKSPNLVKLLSKNLSNPSTHWASIGKVKNEFHVKIQLKFCILFLKKKNVLSASEVL